MSSSPGWATWKNITGRYSQKERQPQWIMRQKNFLRSTEWKNFPRSRKCISAQRCARRDFRSRQKSNGGKHFAAGTGRADHFEAVKKSAIRESLRLVQNY